jgi:hypothetical protein
MPFKARASRALPTLLQHNTDQDKKKRNLAEISRHRYLGFCFKCTPSALINCQFVHCPRHGTAAVQSNAASTVASVRRARQPRRAGLSRPPYSQLRRPRGAGAGRRLPPRSLEEGAEQADCATNDAGSSGQGSTADNACLVAHHGTGKTDGSSARTPTVTLLTLAGVPQQLTALVQQPPRRARPVAGMAYPAGPSRRTAGRRRGRRSPWSGQRCSIQKLRSRGATAEDGTAPVGGENPAADESDGRPIHHGSISAHGHGPIPSATVSLPALCEGGASPSWPRCTRGSGLPHLSMGHVPRVIPDLSVRADGATTRMTVAT